MFRLGMGRKSVEMLNLNCTRHRDAEEFVFFPSVLKTDRVVQSSILILENQS